MSQEVHGGVSGERLHMVYDPKANRFLTEPQPKPSRGVAGAVVDLAEMILSSEGAPPRSVEGSSVEKSEKATTTQPLSVVQEQGQITSPRPAWRLGDLLLRRSQQVPEKTSATSSTDSFKKPSSSEESYTEAYDEQGRLYHKRVAVEG